MSTEQAQATRVATEKAVVATVNAEMAEMRDRHPDYFAYLDDAMPETAEREVIVDLMNSAPDARIRFWLHAMFMMRLSISIITGREFK